MKAPVKAQIKLMVGGAVVFWLTTVVTSLLPIAAEYRAAYSNWRIQTVWIGSLFAGMLNSCFVSYLLLRFFDKIPIKGPVQKSVMLSGIALGIAIILIDVPMLLQEPSASLYFFFIGIMFNTVRFLFLGMIIGYLYKRLN